MTEKHDCPRRSETPGGVFRHNSPDVWRQRGGLAGQENVGRSCSYCGSLHPGRFMELVREGWVVGPTDKPYKAFLARPLASESGMAAKFYYQHLSADQKREFADLYNAKAMRLSYPGYLYVLPFFMSHASQEAS